MHASSCSRRVGNFAGGPVSFQRIQSEPRAPPYVGPSALSGWEKSSSEAEAEEEPIPAGAGGPKRSLGLWLLSAFEPLSHEAQRPTEAVDAVEAHEGLVVHHSGM